MKIYSTENMFQLYIVISQLRNGRFHKGKKHRGPQFILYTMASIETKADPTFKVKFTIFYSECVKTKVA